MKDAIKSLTPRQLVQIINNDFGLDISEINKNGNYVLARDLYFNLAHKFFYPKMTFAKIGAVIKRKHATVMHSVNKTKPEGFAERMEQYKKNIDLGNTNINSTDQPSTKLISTLNKLQALELKYNELMTNYKKLNRLKKDNITLQLEQFPEHKREEILERFRAIVYMESLKKTQYREQIEA